MHTETDVIVTKSKPTFQTLTLKQGTKTEKFYLVKVINTIPMEQFQLDLASSNLTPEQVLNRPKRGRPAKIKDESVA